MTSERLDFENIVDLIMAEEPLPTYEAMTRWVGRYPLYAHELKEFFKTWAFAEAEAATVEPAAINNEELVQGGVAFALELARQQGRIAGMQPSVEPAPPRGASEVKQPLPKLNFEQAILAAIYALRDNAYSYSIWEKVNELLDRQTNFGSLCVTLTRLEKGGLIGGRIEKSDRTRGKNQRYFTITVAGRQAMDAAKTASDNIGGFLGEFA